MAEQILTFVVAGVTLPDTLDQMRDKVNSWLQDHPDAVVNTIDTELVPREHNSGEWVYVVALAVRVPSVQH